MAELRDAAGKLLMKAFDRHCKWSRTTVFKMIHHRKFRISHFRRNFFFVLDLAMPALVEYDAKMENVAKGDIPMSGESGAIAEIHPRARTLVQPICTPSITKSRRDPSNLSGVTRSATNSCQTQDPCHTMTPMSRWLL